MEPFKFSEPRPKLSRSALLRHQFPVRHRHYLDVPAKDHQCSGWDMLDGRRSASHFGPLTTNQLGQLLWLGSKSREIRKVGSNIIWESRQFPSAGGCHPIELMIIQNVDSRLRASLYDSKAHALCELEPKGGEWLEKLWNAISDAVPIEDGIAMQFVAQPQATGSKYDNPDTLIWRDAGAVTCTICLAAQVLNMACKPFGATGNPFVGELLNSGNAIWGVGGCVVGSAR